MPQKPTIKNEISATIIEFPQTRLAPAASRNMAEALSTVNKNELTSITALTSFVANKKNVPEEVVRAVVQSEFHVEDVAKLRRADYERVIKFLVDLQLDLLMN